MLWWLSFAMYKCMKPTCCTPAVKLTQCYLSIILNKAGRRNFKKLKNQKKKKIKNSKILGNIKV